MNEKIKRAALRKIDYGVYVIGVRAAEQVNAFTADWLSQCSFKPPLIMLAVRQDSGSNQIIREGRVFTVSVLAADQKHVAEHFMQRKRRAGNKLVGIEVFEGVTGAPILCDCAAFFECEVQDIFDIGDHAVIIGEVVQAGVLNDKPTLRLSETGWAYGG